MKKALEVTLGIMTALGGFVDIGQLVFTMQAAAVFGYQLVWAIALGTLGIIVFMEMCGRVAAAPKKPVFHIVRERLGKRIGVVALAGANVVNVITCAAELGAVGIILRLLSGLSYGWLTIIGTVGIFLIVTVLRFKWIERLFGIAGLLMLVYIFAAVRAHPDWSAVLHGLIPTVPSGDLKHKLLYAYFAVGLFSAVLMPYEVYFYSSGGIEERWKVEDIQVNKFIATISSLLGACLTVSLVALSAIFFLPNRVFPDLLSTTILAASIPLGHTALLLALGGVLAAVGGAAVETALSTAYNFCQFFDWKWGKAYPMREVPRFTLLWMGTFVVALSLVLTHIDPLTLVESSIIFGLLPLPLTYLPVLLAASDKREMGKHVNAKSDSIVGWIFFVLVTIAAIAALPLMIATHGGKP
jgi:manganese transport protein